MCNLQTHSSLQVCCTLFYVCNLHTLTQVYRYAAHCFTCVIYSFAHVLQYALAYCALRALNKNRQEFDLLAVGSNAKSLHILVNNHLHCVLILKSVQW